MRWIHSIQWTLPLIAILIYVNQSEAQVGGNLIWKNSADLYVNSVSPAGDVNGDGISDIFVGSADNRIYCYSGANGSILWSWAFYDPVLIAHGFIDINGDGANECLVSVADDKIACMSGNGSEILWSRQMADLASIWSIATIENIDGDGMADVLIGTANDSVLCLNGQYGYSVWSYATSSDVRSVHAIDDVNGDGRPDCLAGGDGDKILCLSGWNWETTDSIWTYQAGGAILSVASITDVNADGIEDCIAGSEDNSVYCISGASSGKVLSPLWAFQTQSTVKSVSTIADVNGDGIDDCIAGGEDNYVYCLSGLDGTEIWKYNTGSTVLNVSTISDVNGTGGEDCIAGNDGDNFYCIEGKSSGTGTVLWSYSAGGQINTIASIADLNGNGVQDVIAGSNDSYIYAIEGRASATPTETVSTPVTPAGPSSGTVGQSLSFSTGGAASSLGHSVEYRFDWGDGSYSGWGFSSQSHTYTNVTTVTVKAQARCTTHTGVLSSWSSGKSVTLTGHTLTVTVSGAGTVTKDPDKIQYNHNESVDLTAIPSGGYQFDHWSGALTGSDPTESMPMTESKSVTAYFTQASETISIPATPTGPSTGTVGQNLSYSTGGAASSLGHIVEYRFDWGDGSYSNWGSSSQNHTYTNATTVTVKAQARCTTHTSVLSSWSSGKSVTLTGHTLTVTVNGSGTVTKDPNKTQYNHNESVDLTASPSSGYLFDHWSGALTGSDPTESTTMTENKSVTAYFTQTSETISTPATPTGASTATVGQNISYSTEGATSSLGHIVEYRFDWGDGSFSSWGFSTQSHTYTNINTVIIKAQARCTTHTGIVSAWSSGKTVALSGHTLTVAIDGSGTVIKDPDKTQYNHNESVDLTASPSLSHLFDHWSGALTGSDPIKSITMTGNKSVTAHFTQTDETISTPDTPTGPSSGTAGQNLSFFTGGSASNLGHTVEYRFDWGDGSFSSWGSSSQSHTYTNISTVIVKAQARCTTHTGVTSFWSSGKTVTLSGHTLTVTVSGAGTVTKYPDRTEYTHNESVYLLADPHTGYQFDHWSGALTGSDPTEYMTMTESKSVTAYFTQTSETISTPTTPAGPSSETVGQSLSYSTGGSTSNQGHSVAYRFDWGDGSFSDWGSSSQSHTYINAATVTIKAQARCTTHTGVLSSWSSGKGVTLSGHTLTVTIDGSGTVFKNPDKTEYDHNESVDLIVNPSTSYQFDHWSGSLTGSNPAELIIMTENKSVTAYFTQSTEIISTPTTPTGPSSGTVGEALTFSTGGGVSNLGHDVEYRFDWGDGHISAWGSSTQSYFWNSEGYNLVVAQARCATHTSVKSEWSSTKLITINPTAIEIIEDDHIPDEFQLSQNIPNPFNPETSITFQLPYRCDIRLEIFNIHGEHVATLVSGSTPPGTFETHWDGKNDFGNPVPSGFYIYRLQSEHFTLTKKMLFLK